MTLLYSQEELEEAIAAPRAWAAKRELVFEGTWDAWAVFDHLRDYRYLLCRRWDLDASLQAWIMLNPSIAGATGDDPTIRKCRGFSKRRAGGIVVANLAALISTDPTGLGRHADPVGKHNMDAIEFALSAPSVRVAGWGRFPSKSVEKRLLASSMHAKMHGARWCYGLTQDGQPRHPLMLAYDTPLVSISGDGTLYP